MVGIPYKSFSTDHAVYGDMLGTALVHDCIIRGGFVGVNCLFQLLKIGLPDCIAARYSECQARSVLVSVNLITLYSSPPSGSQSSSVLPIRGMLIRLPVVPVKFPLSRQTAFNNISFILNISPMRKVTAHHIHFELYLRQQK